MQDAETMLAAGAPSGLGEQASVDPLAEVERLGRARVSKVEALREVDALQRRLFEALFQRYGDEHYAKVIALKIANFALAKYHFANRHVRLVSRPVTLMHDPSNACQLRCPSCVHTENKEYSRGMLWPAATMKVAAFERVLAGVGPFAFNVVYYNYGEPLLNKHVPDLLRISNGYGLSSSFSTNLSLEFDVEAFVAAAPEHVILSIDGITQETYGRYRKRGRLDLVLENVRRLVSAKRELGSNRPYLSWRMFTFEHNIHEVDQAIEVAREMGVDEIQIATPFDVSLDDPGIRVAKSEREGRHVFLPWEPRQADRALARLDRQEEISRAFDERWEERARGVDMDEPSNAAASTCIWLYFSMTVDAAQRMMPCCMAPTVERPLVYGNMADSPPEPFNVDGFMVSRLGFADRKRFLAEQGDAPDARAPFCTKCDMNPMLSYGPREAVGDMCALDFRCALSRDEGLLSSLARW